MRISDWGSDVCSSDLVAGITHAHVGGFPGAAPPVPKKEASPRPQRIATARRLASTRRTLLSAPCLSSGQPAPRRRARRSLARPAHHILPSPHHTYPATLHHEHCNPTLPLPPSLSLGGPEHLRVGTECVRACKYRGSPVH